MTPLSVKLRGLVARFVRQPPATETGYEGKDLYERWHPSGPSLFGTLLYHPERPGEVIGFRAAFCPAYGPAADAIELERLLIDRNNLRGALRELIDTQEMKEAEGKSGAYQRRRYRAWERARHLIGGR